MFLLLTNRPLLTAIAFALATLASAAAFAQEDAAAEFDGHPASYWVSQLQEIDFTLRRRAVYALGELGTTSPAALPAVIQALGDGHMEVRWYAAAAVGRFGGDAESAVPALIKSLESKVNDAIVRRSAARSLGKIGPAAIEGVPVLETALAGDDAELQVAAAGALWRIDARAASLRLLSETLSKGSPDAAFAAAIELASIGPAAAPVAGEVARSLQREDEDVRRGAVEALVAMGLPAIDPLVKLLADSTFQHQADAAIALGLIGAQLRTSVVERPDVSPREFAESARPLVQQAIPALVRMLGEKDEARRHAAVQALAATGLVAVPALITSLSSADEPTRQAAASALARLEGSLPGAENSSASLAAVRKRIVGQIAVPLESDQLDAQIAATRLIAALRVTGEESPAALAAVQKLLSSEDVTMRRWADRAVKQLRPQP